MGAAGPLVPGAARQDHAGDAAPAALPVAVRGAALSRGARRRAPGGDARSDDGRDAPGRRAGCARGGGPRLGARSLARPRRGEARRRAGRFTCGRSGARCFCRTCIPRRSPRSRAHGDGGRGTSHFTGRTWRSRGSPEGSRSTTFKRSIDELAKAPCGQGYGRFVLGHLAYAGGEWGIAKRYLEAFVRRTAASRPAMSVALEPEVRMAKATLAKMSANSSGRSPAALTRGSGNPVLPNRSPPRTLQPQPVALVSGGREETACFHDRSPRESA